MKAIITIFICCCLFIREPTTCYCQDGKLTWTAYCGKLNCEKCCEKTKPKNE